MMGIQDNEQFVIASCWVSIHVALTSSVTCLITWGSEIPDKVIWQTLHNQLVIQQFICLKILFVTMIVCLQPHLNMEWYISRNYCMPYCYSFSEECPLVVLSVAGAVLATHCLLFVCTGTCSPQVVDISFHRIHTMIKVFLMMTLMR